MKGITLNELYENLINSHDVEFVFNNKTFVIQAESDDDKDFLAIWEYDPHSSKCLSKRQIPSQNAIPRKVIDEILNDKCIDKKSFMDLEEDIKVTIIY